MVARYFALFMRWGIAVPVCWQALPANRGQNLYLKKKRGDRFSQKMINLRPYQSKLVLLNGYSNTFQHFSTLLC
ncbi:hypothetical protein [Microscilla marina]|uniref:Uncharacterized protein n=1 Tax=Microscilla marina ATCC 23134 TaxID=313606 RepID=A1ZNA3_MICM2|nr:hypothetical protein [Microscilla marina]EAY28284.1 hypothetical protein M23134_03545 [Microscilla marina ATCC 23134]